jgi:hypothetical protein
MTTKNKQQQRQRQLQKTNAGILRYAQDDSGKLAGCDGWCSRRALLKVSEVWV